MCRQALDGGAGGQHVCAAPIDLGRNNALAGGVRYISDTYKAFYRYGHSATTCAVHHILTETGRNFIEFAATVAEAESLFNTEYHRYEHHKTGAHRVACDEYSLPAHMQEHIDFVMPTIQLDGLQPIAQTMPAYLAPVNQTGLTGTTNCIKLITIDCLRALYNIPVNKHCTPGNELGIAEWADYLYLYE